MAADIFGLILNFIGAVVLAISANMRGSVVAGILGRIAGHEESGSDGTSGHAVEKLYRKNRLSKLLNVAGFVLFVVGFGLQIICQQFDCFEGTCLRR